MCFVDSMLARKKWEDNNTYLLRYVADLCDWRKILASCSTR